MATSQQKKALRQYRRDNGLCIHCGNTARPARKTCQPCADKESENSKRYAARDAKLGICCNSGCHNKPEHGNKYCGTCNNKSSTRTSTRRNAWQAAGLCSHCGKQPLWNDKTRCEDCHKTLLVRVKQLSSSRIAEGRCGRCGDHVLVPGYTSCQTCLDAGCARHAAVKLEVLDAYGGPVCGGCGETEVAVLQMDHINGGGNKHAAEIGNGNIASGRGKMYKWLRDNNFPPGFRVLCSNCNIRAARGIPFPNESSSQS